MSLKLVRILFLLLSPISAIGNDYLLVEKLWASSPTFPIESFVKIIQTTNSDEARWPAQVVLGTHMKVNYEGKSFYTHPLDIKAYDKLVKTIESRPPWLQICALSTLSRWRYHGEITGNMINDSLFRSLVSGMRSSSTQVQLLAIQEITWFGYTDNSWEILVDLTSDQDWRVKRFAIYSIGQVKTPEYKIKAARFLIQLMGSTNSEQARSALRSIRGLGKAATFVISEIENMQWKADFPGDGLHKDIEETLRYIRTGKTWKLRFL